MTNLQIKRKPNHVRKLFHYEPAEQHWVVSWLFEGQGQKNKKGHQQKVVKDIYEPWIRLKMFYYNSQRHTRDDVNENELWGGA